MNTSRFIIIKVEKIGSDTMLASIIEMVAQSQQSRVPIECLTDVIC